MTECTEATAAKFLAALAREDMKHWRRYWNQQASFGNVGKGGLTGLLPTGRPTTRPCAAVIGTMHARERPDLFNKPTGRKAAMQACEGFIRRRLANGRTERASDILAAGVAAGFTYERMRSARRRLGVKLSANSRAGLWSLPEPLVNESVAPSGARGKGSGTIFAI